jgi:hypothetical protein
MDWVITGRDAPGIRPRPDTAVCSKGVAVGAPRTDRGANATEVFTPVAPIPEVKLRIDRRS